MAAAVRAIESTPGMRTDPTQDPRPNLNAECLMCVKRLRPSAVMPVRGSGDAAGFDLSASEATSVPAGGKAVVKTGLAISIPRGTYARIAPRSGLAAKRMINTGAGVVDFDYRGELGVVLFNHGPEQFDVTPGDRVAQLILEQISMVDCIEVQSLEETVRGVGGFGSTGVAKAPVEGATVAATGQAGTGPATMDVPMRVLRINPAASMPIRGSIDAAGFDLAAAEATIVKAGGKAIVKTGLSVAIPKQTYGRIAPRSGLAAKKMIQVGAGVVDYDYRGEVGVVLFNHGAEDFEVAIGDRVAQFILERISMSSCEEVQDLDDTTRGASGFGSTGVSQDGVTTPSKRPRDETCTNASSVLEATCPATALRERMNDIANQLQMLQNDLARLEGTTPKN